jgi:hypothetical protein
MRHAGVSQPLSARERYGAAAPHCGQGMAGPGGEPRHKDFGRCGSGGIKQLRANCSRPQQVELDVGGTGALEALISES